MSKVQEDVTGGGGGGGRRGGGARGGGLGGGWGVVGGGGGGCQQACERYPWWCDSVILQGDDRKRLSWAQDENDSLWGDERGREGERERGRGGKRELVRN